MTGLLSAVRRKIDQSCIVNKCSKDGCSVSLGRDSRNRLVIDCDRSGSPFGSSQTRCDYLLFEEAQIRPGRATPIELKSGRIRAQDVIEQLQAGAAAVENLIPTQVDVRLLPLLAYGNIPKGERAAINKGIVRFRGEPERIERIRCGSPLPPR